MTELVQSLAAMGPDVVVEASAPLRSHTRFGVGGDAALLVDAYTDAALIAVIDQVRAAEILLMIIGGGTNLVVADSGFPGVVLRYRAHQVRESERAVRADAGAELQDLVDFTIGHALAGLHTMTRIPGWVGAAVYGNAGAYGHSIHEFVTRVRFFDGREIRWLDREACRFAYRESIFKQRKDWVILSVELELPSGHPDQLVREAEKIREIRDAKYPPSMRCAGSIFKNLLLDNLASDVASQVPGQVVREGKVPAAWFLEQVGAKGMRRGDIQVAGYHANLVYNDGLGTAADLRAVIAELKRRVVEQFGLELEEEVQYVGF